MIIIKTDGDDNDENDDDNANNDIIGSDFTQQSGNNLRFRYLFKQNSQVPGNRQSIN